VDVAQVVALKPGVVVETPHARVVAALADDAEATLFLADGTPVSYTLRAAGEPARAELKVDPMLRGNAFKPLHDSARAQAALLSVAASRRMESGPQSERAFVILRGSGLVFLENGDTMRIAPGDVAIVPAGEPARLWAQTDDLLVVALQPKGQDAPRRTLAGELRRLKAAPRDADRQT
jgi:quercetin dioxygenase-like cupin family protein